MTFLNFQHEPNQKLRAEIVNTALKMNARGINHNKAGNVSARIASGFIITPTGVAYEILTTDQLVAMSHDGVTDDTNNGKNLPSSEWRFHHDIYAARPDVSAIVHTHSIYATTLAVLGQTIPAFHYMVAAAGGENIRCAAYATFGTQALSDLALVALTGRNACLLAQHGVIACGATLDSALSLAVEVEVLAKMYVEALKTGLPIPILDASEMAVVIEKFRTYGANAKH